MSEKNEAKNEGSGDLKKEEPVCLDVDRDLSILNWLNKKKEYIREIAGDMTEEQQYDLLARSVNALVREKEERILGMLEKFERHKKSSSSKEWKEEV